MCVCVCVVVIEREGGERERKRERLEAQHRSDDVQYSVESLSLISVKVGLSAGWKAQHCFRRW